MAIVAVFDLPGATQAQYDETVRRLTNGGSLDKPSDWPVPGLVSHAAGPTPTGWHVTDVWESREAFERFGEVLRPILQEVGMAGQPVIFEAHRVVT
ncbi:hypothetical protein [Kitasatospora sp. NPDC097643]|uniref:hypothetical protein n=1 Tax=Kitasatospora sp. NPDC097643 TaxID=3157230 RepID=UPI003320D7AE